MSSRAPSHVVVVGSRAELAAQPFEAAWGDVRLAHPDDAEGDGADLAIILDPELSSAWSGSAQVVWHPQAGDSWARPWPVADALFEVPPSTRDDTCLVLAPDPSDSEIVVERLTETGLEVRVAPGATRDSIEDARIVVCLTPGFAAETFAVLAAGRVLVAPASEQLLGLQAWVDHLPFSNTDELVEVAGAVAAHPDSWRPIQAFARQSAEPQRADQAVGRLVRRTQAMAARSAS